ncbi:MAG: alpha/beta hydrolase [Syntrophaceae bacterium]|nr:alpha/beta hydrolase [Syntrophaceae bacterium]
MTVQESVAPLGDLLELVEERPGSFAEHFSVSSPWLNRETSAWYLEKIFQYQEMLDYGSRYALFWWPFSGPVLLQQALFRTLVTDPIRKNVQVSLRLRKDPDMFRETDNWISEKYAHLTCRLTSQVMSDDRFDPEKARQLTDTVKGREVLRFFVSEFSKLEKMFSSQGLTKLKAQKNLVRSLLAVITETSLNDSDLPFMKCRPDGSAAMTFQEYLVQSRKRIENLYRADAFDPKGYSERATRGKIGCSGYEILEESQMHSVLLRHYAVPEGVRPNGNVLYLSTPLINKPEIFDLAPGKSVIEGLLAEGYHVYMVDYGQPLSGEGRLGLDFYAKTVHDYYLNLIAIRHPGSTVDVVGYCMGGSLILPFLARRAEERLAADIPMDIRKICLMAAPVRFDDGESGHGPMRSYIRKHYNSYVMTQLFGSASVPPQVIDEGVSEIQPGVQYSVMMGFYDRAIDADAIADAAPFLYWLTHGTRFPARAHQEWLDKFFIGNELMDGRFRLPSTDPDLDGKPVNMDALRKADVAVFDYRGSRDPIAPAGSCIASETWGRTGNGNRTIEKDIGHIFVVSRKLLSEFLSAVKDFLQASDAPPQAEPSGAPDPGHAP